MALVTDRIGVNGGLGYEGAGFDGMVRGFTLKGGDESTRVSPLFPALAWIPTYTVIRDVPRSFTMVDAASIAVLVLAACMLVDDRRGGVRWKLLVALSLTMAIAFAKVAAFVPGNASLCALAALMLAVALCSPERPMLTAAAHVAAVMALPIGLVAPLYGVVRAARLHVRASRIALMFGPAALMWLFVQWWARGGVAGVLEDFAPHRLSGSVDIWMQPLFLTFALYFLVTAGGGLSLIAFVHPAAWARLARRSPEAIVLAGPLTVYVRRVRRRSAAGLRISRARVGAPVRRVERIAPAAPRLVVVRGGCAPDAGHAASARACRRHVVLRRLASVRRVSRQRPRALRPALGTLGSPLSLRRGCPLDSCAGIRRP